MTEQLCPIRVCKEANAFPLVIEARTPGASVFDAIPALMPFLDHELKERGALLFRDFAIENVKSFHDFVDAFGQPLLNYDFASTPRSIVENGVYTSTEYPASQHIPLHNEQSYTREWAMKLWLYCMHPAEAGGETPIADSRKIYHRIDGGIRQRFTDKGLMYVRNYGNGLDLPWQKVFNTADRRAVEDYCCSRGILYEWKPDGELRTKQVSQAIERHPLTLEHVWFNQAHLFHISALDPAIRSTLLDVVDIEDLPRNVYYGDGTNIEDVILEEIRCAIDDATVSFAWKAGDILLIDNMLTAHGRRPFKGLRKVFVAMTGYHSNL